MVGNVEPKKRIRIGDIKPTKRNAIHNVESPGRDDSWNEAPIFVCPKSDLLIRLSVNYSLTYINIYNPRFTSYLEITRNILTRNTNRSLSKID